MRKYLLSGIILVLAFCAGAQTWKTQLPEKLSGENYTLFEYQKAFYNYWESFNVKGGYYFDENNKKQKAPGWKQFKRWEYFWESRVDISTGAFPVVNLTQVYKEYVLNNSSGRSIDGDWISLGPNDAPGGYWGIGRLNCISFHPTDTDIFWVGAPAGGIWVTEDGGSTWEILNDYEDVIGVSDIAVPSDYGTSSTIYIATGDRDHWDNRSIGVLKSTDGGTSWNATGLSFTIDEGENTYRLLLDPNDDETIVASTTDGVYKTTNGGANWTLLSSHSFIDLEYKPGDYNTLYGSNTDGEIYYSTNGGLSWTMSHNSGYRIELAVTPDEPDWVYAVVASASSGLHGVYQSTNSGVNFSMVFDGSLPNHNLLGWSSSGTGSSGQGWYDLSLAVSPTDGNTIYLGGVNTWRSLNGGISFQIVSHWSGSGAQAVHADKHALKYNELNNELYEVNDGGVYSTTTGTFWTDLSEGLIISQMYRLGTSKTNADETITGLQDNGTKLNHNNGNWDDVKGGDGMECIIDYTDVNIQYGTYINGQISRTINHWASSTDISSNIPGGPAGAWVTPYLIDPVDPQTLYVGYTDVWKTTNRGNSFNKIGNFSGSKLRSMAIYQTDPDYIFIATYDNIKKTENGGSSWIDITAGLPVGSANIKYIAVKDDDPEIIWVAMSSYSGDGVYKSDNGGTTWGNVSTGLPNIPVNTIVYNKLNTTENELYAGTDAGVYVKVGTDNWAPFSTGLSNVVIDELEIYYDDVTSELSRIRAATFGRGLWESDLYNSPDDLTAYITSTPGCYSGTVTISSSQSGLQTFYLTDAGGVLLDSATVTAVNFDFDALDDNIYRGKVKKDGLESSLTDEEELINLVIPAQPEEIFGPDTVCETAIVVYSVNGSTTEGLSYNWTIPESWSGESTTESITVTIGEEDGTIEVYVSNDCGDGSPQTLDVTVMNLPADAGDISGDYRVCIGEEDLIYTVDEIENAVIYIWSVPVGIEITEGTNTNQITVNVSEDAVTGVMTVYGENECGTGLESTEYYIEVNTIPGMIGDIIGPSLIVNPEEIALYEVGEVEGAEVYNWILDPTWTLVNGEETNQIEIQFGADAADGVLEVNGENYCGTTESTSLQIDIIQVGIDELSSQDVVIYPNPAKGIIHIEFSETPANSVAVLVKNLNGETIHHSNDNTGKSIEIDLKTVATGVYLMKIMMNDKVMTRRIVVNN